MPDVEITLRREHAPGDRTMLALERGDEGREVASEKRHRLDEDDATSLHRSLLGHYQREIDRQREFRRDMELDEDIYDGLSHWSDADAWTVRQRGQMPLVYNITFNAVNWLLGSQRAKPVDYSILPRTARGREHAEKKAQLMKYLRDVDDGRMMDAEAFAEVVKAGLSWFETGAQGEEDGEPVFERWVSWRDMIYDSAARRRDLEDARYLVRTKWVDLDTATAMFPERSSILRRSAEDILGIGTDRGLDSMGDSAMDSREAYTGGQPSGLLHLGRRRLRLYEAWYKRAQKFDVMRGGEFAGEIYDEGSDRHEWSRTRQGALPVPVVRQRVMVGVFADAGMLWAGPSPYRHNRYPFTPVWGYRRARDGSPYGMIRQVRDIQMDLNKRGSKALWHATAKRVFYEEGSVTDPEQLREEAHRPDAMIGYAAGRRRPEIENDLQYAAAQADMMGRNIDLIEQTAGVTGENMGRASNPGQSGRAIIARQDQGELATNAFFESMRYARKKHGEKVLATIEQFYTAEKVFRITNERGNPEFVGINTADPSVDDYIAMSRADFIVAEEDYRASHRQASLDKLIELAQMLASAAPQVIVGILDLLIEAMDIPKGGEIVKRIRQTTGIPDPEADPNNPDPETQALQAEKAAQAALQKRGVEAGIAAQEAKADLTAQQARKTALDADARMEERQAAAIGMFSAAIDTAMKAAGVPTVARAADLIIEQARALIEGGGQGGAPDAGPLPVAAAMPSPMLMPGSPMPPPLPPEPMAALHPDLPPQAMPPGAPA